MTKEQEALLKSWSEAKEALFEAKALIETEQELRKLVFAAFFPSPKEGVNAVDLNHGWKLKGDYKIDRKIDESSLNSVRDPLMKMGISLETIVRYKPELKLKEFKGLTKEQQQVFGHALIAKPASPTIELVAPKEPS